MSEAQRGMGTDPSHELARLRHEYPRWTINAVTGGWTAEQRAGSKIRFMHRATADLLDRALASRRPARLAIRSSSAGQL
jgi:hypothetical protein